MIRHLRRAVLISIVFFAVCGLAYPWAVTGISQAFLSYQANGSLTAHGSAPVGQPWKGPLWFQGRPDPYTPDATGPSVADLGPRSKVLVHDVKARIAQLRAEGITPTPDLVTYSFYGSSANISPHSAYVQVDAVARARHLPPATLRRLVASHVTPAQYGFLGSPYVNVLKLNEALARLR
jgi:K+-transporting ATPase ATPase C chain